MVNGVAYALTGNHEVTAVVNSVSDLLTGAYRIAVMISDVTDAMTCAVVGTVMIGDIADRMTSNESRGTMMVCKAANSRTRPHFSICRNNPAYERQR